MGEIVKRNLSNYVYIYRIVINRKVVIVHILVFHVWNTVLQWWFERRCLRHTRKLAKTVVATTVAQLTLILSDNISPDFGATYATNGFRQGLRFVWYECPR